MDKLTTPTSRTSTLSSPRFAAGLIGLHWLTLLLIAAVYALMEFKGIYPKGSAGREAMAQWHFTLGMTVLAVTAVRLLVRLGSRRPPIVPPSPRWQELLAGAVTVLLYGLMIALPVLGWLAVSAYGEHVSFWGLTLPSPLAVDKTLAHDIKEVHETLAEAGYWLIGLHAAAALFHHYLLHDNTLVRMLPGRADAR